MRRLLAELLPKLKATGRNTPVIVAGNPENAAKLAAAGVADFVHARSNPVEVLTKWQGRLGIKEFDAAGLYQNRLEDGGGSVHAA